MNDYNGVSGKQRLASWELTKKAMASGEIPYPAKCEICGKTAGRIDYHNETYSSPTKDLLQICQGCHMRWHKRSLANRSFIKYFIEEGRFKKLNKPMLATLKKEGYLDGK